ncbi:MAG: histidinol-phosphate aminotransferase family protein [Candidatus Mcinerneyibacterium aminivorans]|uniref:Histidinol-phosphate aminotransferase family protein n=1 Tax=Candidatus Mcinerneyibacterium aminivorans TaxID=2703815 RepID=A0A5D0MBU8_9BACT|nr:MAG: histidinol-phosphate aminotransferase family protein [Candidatus Mcinerneyibacterium aminivorans]
MLYRKELDELKDFSVYRGNYIAKMDQNESPFNLFNELKDEIFDKIRKRDLNRYTKLEDIKKLKTRIADYNSINSKNVAVGAGADSFIHSIIEIFSINQGKVLTTYPTYPIYKLFSKINGVNTVTTNLEIDDFSLNKDDFSEKIKNSKVIFLTYPNNPTGNLYSRDFILENIEKYSNKLFAIDEAYFEFAEDSFAEYIHDYENLVIIRTFSKFFSIPSLRLGYIIANEKFVNLFEKCQFAPYNVSLFSIITGMELIKNYDYFKKNRDKIVSERNRLFKEISKLNSLKPYPSKTNFIFIKERNEKNIADYLYKNKIFVRDFSSMKNLEGFFRITVSSKKENNYLIEKLKKWNKK